jgi:hypothetical protein
MKRATAEIYFEEVLHEHLESRLSLNGSAISLYRRPMANLREDLLYQNLRLSDRSFAHYAWLGTGPEGNAFTAIRHSYQVASRPRALRGQRLQRSSVTGSPT